jgi:putative S-layer protein (peptidoglycan anchored)
MEGTLKIRELSDWMLLGENKDRIRKKVKVESNKKGKVSIRLESKLKDVKILGLDNKEKSEIKANEEIYLEVDIKQIKEDGKIKLNLEAELETNPIYLGEPGNTINQPYAVSGIKVKGKTKISKDFYYKRNGTKIKVKKIDGKTKEGLGNVEFELLDKNKKVIKKLKTDKNGNMIVDDILEGKYYLKEVRAKDGYVLDDKLIEIDIKYQENIEIEISNNKIEVKTEPKPKRVERILPVTGY